MQTRFRLPMSYPLEPRCDCGSGKCRTWQYDGYGIPLCATCDKCHDRKMRKYRKDIHTRYQTEEPIDE